MNKYKRFFKNHIKNVEESIDKIFLSKLDNFDDFTKGQMFAYYDIVNSLKFNSFKLKISLKELEENTINNISQFCKSSDRFTIIKKIINEWDPYDLISLGAPDDEFENEIIEIILKMKNENNLNDIAVIISDVFTKSFNDHDNFTIEKCIIIANKIEKEIK